MIHPWQYCSGIMPPFLEKATLTVIAVVDEREYRYASLNVLKIIDPQLYLNKGIVFVNTADAV